MPQFSFDYNMGDIVRYKWRSVRDKDGIAQAEILRGIVRGILIGDVKSGYMIENSRGTEFVCTDKVIEPVFSTKNFDVMYPGLDIEYRRFGNERPDQFLYAKICSAVIENGRLYYWIESCDGEKFLAPEGKVFLVDSDANKKKFQ